ncbi:hypothetical protein [Streptomyces rubradiris]|uniref:Small secreted domain n=1 Tax=Streptomyces rubradiris TaxID=285531 RepID=A0ABQ3RDL3_STRRR|nr:hypothetical protein [Streptomyces rubradiris]GHH29673.1 hypothetical protein GCM10018792_75110 [Streptomyces rubradiris]GHI53928.1 hypothetical protein Srubr_37740 [Streptomyces rubradiris]
MKRALTGSCLAALAVGLAPVPASAGGILPIASPSFATSCTNHGAPHAGGATAHGTGTANGNLAGLPVGSPFNHCGGAELDISSSLPIVGSLLGGGSGAANAADADDEST